MSPISHTGFSSPVTVRVGGAIGMPQVLKRFGIDPADVLTEAGLSPALFENPDTRISYAARGRLLAHCVERTGCSHFGLLVGQLGNLNDLGIVGLLMKYSRDLRTALLTLVTHFRLHSGGVTISLLENDAEATLSYEIYQPDVEATDQTYDGAVAMMFNVLKNLCGPGWTPDAVQFAHHMPETVIPFRQFFRAPVYFDADKSALVFQSHWLDFRNSVFDADLYRLLEQEIALEGTRQPDDFTEQVRRALRSAIITGQANEDKVAAVFSMHRRTLNRRLHDAGTSYRELVESTRYVIARQALRDTGLDIADIAELLGYADATAFTRAFRRWSGTTPAAWRLSDASSVEISPR